MIPLPSERAVLSVEETARILGISKSSTYAAAQFGDLPSIKVGHRVLVPTAQLRVLLGLDAPPRAPELDEDAHERGDNVAQLPARRSTRPPPAA